MEVINYLGGSDVLNISFNSSMKTIANIANKPYEVSYSYEGGEKPTLYGVFRVPESDESFIVIYVFTPIGFEATYRRESATGGVTAKRFYRRILPEIVYGSYQSVQKSPNFATFADRLHFPEMKLQTNTDFGEANGSYYQSFQHGKSQKDPLSTVPFVIGEKHHMLVRDLWWMEYVYTVIEGDLTVVQSQYYTRPNSSNHAPHWEPFTRIGIFTPDGYSATFLSANMTAWTIYKRLPASVTNT